MRSRPRACRGPVGRTGGALLAKPIASLALIHRASVQLLWQSTDCAVRSAAVAQSARWPSCVPPGTFLDRVAAFCAHPPRASRPAEVRGRVQPRGPVSPPLVRLR